MDTKLSKSCVEFLFLKTVFVVNVSDCATRNKYPTVKSALLSFINEELGKIFLFSRQPSYSL